MPGSEVMKENAENRLVTPSKLLFYGLSLLVFYLAIRYMGKLGDIKSVLAQVNPMWIILILCLQAGTYVSYALVLYALVSGEKEKVSLPVLIRIAVIQLFINQALPSGGISGNGYVWGQLAKRRISPLRCFKVLIMESVSYYIAFLSALAFTYMLFRYSSYHIPANSAPVAYTTMTGVVFFLSLAAFMLALNNRRTLRFLTDRMSRLRFFKRYIQKIGASTLLQNGADSGSLSVISLRSLSMAVLYQYLLLGCDLLTVYCLLAAFHTHLPALLLILALLLTTVVGSLPVSPGSLIIYESAMTYFLSLLGVPLHVAMIITLLYRFFTFWLPMPAGLWWYRRLQKKTSHGADL